MILTVSLSKSQLDEVDWIPYTIIANEFTVQIAKVGRYTLQKLYIMLLKFYVVLESHVTFEVSF